ncbi:MAG: ATP-dependent DNA helicase RecG [Candidatus Omnitrophota bacterium]
MQVKKQDATSDIRYLKGVGPKRADILKKLGINTVEDILYYLPRRYEDRSNFTLIKDLKVGEFQTVKGSVLTCGVHRTKRGINVFQLALGDETGVIYCVWFNQPYLKEFFKAGQDVIVYGKVERYDKRKIYHPEYEIVKEDADSLNMGKIVPVYPLTEEVNQRYVRFLTHEAIGRFAFSIKETLPANVRARNRLVDSRFAIRNIHFPVSFENLDRAYRRLVFEEFFILQAALALKKKDAKTSSPGIRHRLDARLIDSFKKLFPFELTQSQLKVINEIQIDMASSKPMNRLLEGDVGSGKTAVAIYALLLTVENGYQAAVMAPTEILARQHYINMSALLMPLGVNVRLLVSGLKPAKKLEIKNEIEKGQVDIVIGTHALIWEGVEFEKLGLAIIDEQHKFGVTQRQLLRKKGESPDVLVMTATPIPRTLALTVYGDLDISVIRELPKGRYPITTYCVEEDKRRSVYEFIREEIKKGRQA